MYKILLQFPLRFLEDVASARLEGIAVTPKDDIQGDGYKNNKIMVSGNARELL